MQKRPNCIRQPRLWHRCLTKTLLVMRLTSILLTVSILHVAAKGVSQTVSFTGKEVPLKKVFTAIEDQTGYVVFCDASVLADAKPVTVEARGENLQDFLMEALQGQPLEFTILKKTIFVKKKPEVVNSEPVPATVIALPPPGRTIVVRVIDTSGAPVENASVSVKGTKLGGSTDKKGIVTISNVQDNAFLLVSYVGFATVKVGVNGRDVIDVVLKRSESPLDETQIIAYGSTTKRLATGDVSTVSSKDIESQPLTSPLLALEGRIPGLVISPQPGYAGASYVGVRVQGQISLFEGSEPLIVVDGLPYPEYKLFGASNGSGLDYLNSFDIAEITVLKDADATSIYGSRAAAGAILITTKKGAAGNTKVSFDYQTGFSKVTRWLDLMNTQQYLQMRNQGYQNDGATPTASDYDVNGVWDQSRYTDWQKVFYGGSASFSNAQVSVSGGNANTQFRFSGNYHKQGILTPGNFSIQQGSGDLNLTNSSANKRLKSSINMQYAINLQHLPVTQGNIELPPDAPALYHPDGSINWARIPTGNGTDSLSTWYNPMVNYWNEPAKTLTNSFIGSITESYQIFTGFEVKANASYNFQNGYKSDLTPSTLWQPEYLASTPNPYRQADFWVQNTKSWQAEPQLSYHRTIGLGQIKALAGATFSESSTLSQHMRGNGYASDAALLDIGAAQTWRTQTDASSDYRYDAVFGQLNYNWDNKYLFDGNFRRDGSSRFGSANLFHDFWSVAGVWIFSEEKMVKNNLSFLSFGKLRGSYGTQGNDQIGDYQFLSSYSFTTPAVPYQGASSLRINGLANPYLEWESMHKISGSIDLGFFKDRLLFNATHYVNRSSNQLLSYPLPVITGFGGILENFPATIQNSGWDFTLSSTNYKKRDFQWTTSLTVSLARNKLVSFPGLATSSFSTQYVVGQPITVRHIFRYAGVDPATGLYQVYKNDGTKTSSPNFSYQPNSDQTKLVDLTPDFYGGIQNTIHYHGFSLDVFLQYACQKGSIGSLYDYYPGNTVSNQPAKLLTSVWKKPGDVTRYAKFSATGNDPNYYTSFYAEGSSDNTIVDASFIRVKSMALSWEFPRSLLARAKMKDSDIRFTIRGENLFTLTKYEGIDPQTGVSGIPPLRTITFGVQAEF